MPELKDWRFQGMSTARMKGLHKAEVEIARCTVELAVSSDLPDEAKEAVKRALERAQQERDYVRAWITAIPDEQIQGALALKYLQCWTWKEIAEIYQSEPETLKKACQRYIKRRKYYPPEWL